MTIVEELRTSWHSWRGAAFPRLRSGVDLEGTEADLAYEDGHLAGLVTTALRRTASSDDGRDSPQPIVLDRSIDERLERAAARYGDDEQTVSSFREYRRKMVEVAELLARSTGAALMWRESRRR